MKLSSFAALASALLLAGGLYSGCSDDEDPACQEGSFQCVGLELQKCVSGAFVHELTCTEAEPCQAQHGHCHHHEGGGGHHEGGGGHHEGGGGHHEGGHHEGGGGHHEGGHHEGGGGGA
jgi:hypothetical protein